MNSYKDLDIYKKAFELAILVHRLSLELPKTEQFEIGSQIRRSSQSIRSNIAEGYGRRKYKAEFIRFLIFSQSSCDETSSHLEMLSQIYPLILIDSPLISEYDILGRMLNSYIQYISQN